MMKHFMKMVAIALVCASCSNELPEMAPGRQSDVPKTNLEYALECAEDLIGQIDPQTRGVSREANVQFVCSPATRSGRQDTLLYLVNYTDNMGFALLDAEGKNGGVYAISPKGHLEFSDSVDNPTLAHFFREVNEAASSEPLIPTSNDSITIIGWKKVGISITNEAKPVLCDRYSKWKCQNVSGAESNGGEGTITSAANVIAKMLAYYYHPATVNGTKITWVLISGLTEYPNEVQKLQVALNKRDFLQDYSSNPNLSDDNGRIITPTLFSNALKRAGINVDPLLMVDCNNNFFSSANNVSNLKNILGCIQPVIPTITRPWDAGPAIAFSKPVEYLNGNQNQVSYYQYWLINGFKDITRSAILNNGQQVHLSTTTLYQCVWGQNGYTDGYYAVHSEGFSNSWATIDGTDIIEVQQPQQSYFPNIGIMCGFDIRALKQP